MRSTRLAGVLAIGLLALTAGCGSQTGVVVAIYSDLPAGELERVVLTAETAGEVYSNADQPWRVGPGQPDRLPGSVILLWGSTLEPMVISVEGYGPTGQAPRLVRRARVEPRPGELQLLRIALTAACTGEGAPACGGNQTCVDGQCAPGPVEGACLLPYRDGDEETLPCQGQTRLRDTRSGEPVPVSGPGCGPAETCLEGCCVAAPRDGGPDGPGPDVPDLGPDLDAGPGPDQPVTPDAPRPDLPDLVDVPPDQPVLPEVVVIGENQGDTFPGPVDDTWLRQGDPDERNDGDGELEIDSAFTDRRIALLRFGLTELANQRVASAELRLNVVRSASNAFIHRVVQPWDDDASWNEARSDQDWSTPGCADRSDCRQDPELLRADLPEGEAIIELPAELVQEWINRPEGNQGVLIRLDPIFNAGQDARIVSSEGPDGTRPRLAITLAR